MGRGTIGTPGSPAIRTYEPLARFTNLTLNGSDVLSGVINNALRSLRDTGGGFLVLPASDDYGILGEPIVLQHRTGIIGNGPRATRLYLADGSNCNMIENYVSSDSGASDPNAQFTTVRDLFLHGNAANQSAGTLDTLNGNTYGRDGIYFTSDPVLTQGSDEYFDTAHTVEHVWIYQVAGNGFTGHSRSEMKLSHVTATEARGYGFVPSYDTFLTSCTAGGCWKGGFWFKDRSSIQGANLKAFYSGHNNPSSPGDAYGFLIENSAGVKLSSCEAQDNCGSGFGLVNTAGGNILAGCVADSNNKDDDAGMPAIDMWNSDDNIIDVLCHDRGANAGNQLNALRIRNTSSGNTIRIKHFTTNTGTIDRAITSDSTTYGNDITVNNLGGTREVGVVNSPYTPNPYDNGTIVMGIDGNTTINAPAAGDTHSGARMRFMIYQDGVGGHTVTFAAAYIMNGGTFTAATAAGAMSVIEFMFDDDSDQWYETSRSVA